MSDGAINTIIRVLSIALQVEPEEIISKELWETEPAVIHVSVPTEVLNASGFSFSQFGRLVNRVVAAGVRAYVLLKGTFQFSETLTTDDEKGFSDNDQLIGGYFGAVYDPGTIPTCRYKGVEIYEALKTNFPGGRMKALPRQRQRRMILEGGNLKSGHLLRGLIGSGIRYGRPARKHRNMLGIICRKTS